MKDDTHWEAEFGPAHAMRCVLVDRLSNQDIQTLCGCYVLGPTLGKTTVTKTGLNWRPMRASSIFWYLSQDGACS